MTLRMGRRVATPALSTQLDPLHEALEELPSLKQERRKPRRGRGLENVAPDQVSPKLPSKIANKENLEAENHTKRKLVEKEASEEELLVEALRRAPAGQSLAALSKLRKALAKPRPAIHGVLHRGGAELLVAALRTASSPSAHVEAAWCLVQLGSGSSTQTKQLIQAGACAAAMEKLQCSSVAESSELCDLLLQLLANVAGDVDSSFRDGLLDAGIVDVLGELFAKMPDFLWSGLEREEVLRSFTWLMASLCRTPCPQLEKVDCAYDFFAQVLLGTEDAEMLGSAMWGLCYLVEGGEEAERSMRARRMLSAGFDEEVPEKHPLLQQVVNCMRAAGDWRCPLPSAALHLAGLLARLPEPAEALLAVGLLPALHADLVDAHAPVELRREAAEALAALAALAPRALAEQPGLVEALQAHEEGTWAILKLLGHGPDMYMRLGPQQALTVLLSALQSHKEASLQKCALERLEQMHELKLCEASMVQKLQRLSSSSDEAVLEKAQLVLKSFFPWATPC